LLSGGTTNIDNAASIKAAHKTVSFLKNIIILFIL